MALLGANSGLVVSFMQAQASVCVAELEVYGHIGSTKQRTSWKDSLNQADRFLSPLPTFSGDLSECDETKLINASDILVRVGAEMARAGLNQHMRLFRPHSPTAEINIVTSDESSQAVAKQLFSRLTESYPTLMSVLDRTYQSHIERLDDKVARMDEIAAHKVIPVDAIYPRYFEEAYPDLMNLVETALSKLHGQPLDAGTWHNCRQAIMSYVLNRQLAREDIDRTSDNPDKLKRGLSLALQVPEYSAFQLLCLLIQIQTDSVDPIIVESLRHVQNGRIIKTERAKTAGVRWHDILKASHLIGDIDIAHANVETATALANLEYPDEDPRKIRLQIMANVALLGHATDSSRREYDVTIARLAATAPLESELFSDNRRPAADS